MNMKKMALVALALIATVATVSAAVLTYYGQIIATVNVKQAVLLDGKDYTTPITEPVPDNIFGGESFWRLHYLQSQTSVPVNLLLETSYSPSLTDAEITTTYNTEITDDNTNFGSRSNEIVAIGTSLTLDKVFADVGLKYEYTVIAGGTYNGASPIIAVLDLADGRHIVLFPGWGNRLSGSYYLQFSDTIAYDSGGNNYVDFVVYDSTFHKTWGSPGSYPAYNGIKTSPGCPITGNEIVARVAIQHQGANTGEKDRLESLAFGGYSFPFIQIPESIQFTLQPGQTVYFVARYKFAVDIQPGTYTIYSTVKPAP
jgi:hypothetical protein